MLRGTTDEGQDDLGIDQGLLRAEGFIHADHLELPEMLPELFQFIVLEVVEKKIRRQDAAFRGCQALEDIALLPADRRVEPLRSWCQVARGQRDSGIFFRQPHQQRALARAYFQHPMCPGSGVCRDLACQPALVAHQEIDDSQVRTAAHHIRMIRGELVDDFRLYNALHHG